MHSAYIRTNLAAGSASVDDDVSNQTSVIQVVEWYNGEGYDISRLIGDTETRISLSTSEITALVQLLNGLVPEAFQQNNE